MVQRVIIHWWTSFFIKQLLKLVQNITKETKTNPKNSNYSSATLQAVGSVLVELRPIVNVVILKGEPVFLDTI